MQTFDIVKIGDATLYHADCREVLPTLGKFDLLLTDPPYGIGYAAAPVVGKNRAAKTKYERGDWDECAPDMGAALRCANASVVWGGNYFGFPAARCWLVWYKPDIAPSLSPVELAWTNLNKNSALFKYSISATGLERTAAGNGHPTQKPLPLMVWCLSFVPAAKSVLDPFMGSGTTGVACAQSGRAFTGIERERKYFDIACERISRAYAQGKLFAPEIVKPQQAEIAA